MRKALEQMLQGIHTHSKRIPEHLGLAYNAWAKTGADGKIPDGERDDWLQNLAGKGISSDYVNFFNRWSGSFDQSKKDALYHFKLTSRLLIGHGNPSATEVGLTLHHTWGVPIITGPALKGLCAHYTVSTFGPTELNEAPWRHEDSEEKQRAEFQGVLWEGNKIEAGPGRHFRALFGAPDARMDSDAPEGYAGAAKGGVIFHDALYDPASENIRLNPFKPDVLTVHNKNYYNNAGKDDQPWPNDYDSPNPVSFLTVQPGARFLVALSGPQAEIALIAAILTEALATWGVAGRTSLGYGRGALTPTS